MNGIASVFLAEKTALHDRISITAIDIACQGVSTALQNTSTPKNHVPAYGYATELARQREKAASDRAIRIQGLQQRGIRCQTGLSRTPGNTRDSGSSIGAG